MEEISIRITLRTLQHSHYRYISSVERSMAEPMIYIISDEPGDECVHELRRALSVKLVPNEMNQDRISFHESM